MIEKILLILSEYTYIMCKEKTCPYKPSYTRLCKECFGVFRNSTCFKNHKQNEVCARATSCEKCGHWFAGPISNHIYESFYCTYCNKEVIHNHECFVEVEKRSKTNVGVAFFMILSARKTRWMLKLTDRSTK